MTRLTFFAESVTPLSRRKLIDRASAFCEESVFITAASHHDTACHGAPKLQNEILPVKVGGNLRMRTVIVAIIVLAALGVSSHSAEASNFSDSLAAALTQGDNDMVYAAKKAECAASKTLGDDQCEVMTRTDSDLQGNEPGKSCRVVGDMAGMVQQAILAGANPAEMVSTNPQVEKQIRPIVARLVATANSSRLSPETVAMTFFTECMVRKEIEEARKRLIDLALKEDCGDYAYRLAFMIKVERNLSVLVPEIEAEAKGGFHIGAASPEATATMERHWLEKAIVADYPNVDVAFDAINKQCLSEYNEAWAASH
jgi:hypothetical protein